MLEVNWALLHEITHFRDSVSWNRDRVSFFMSIFFPSTCSLDFRNSKDLLDFILFIWCLLQLSGLWVKTDSSLNWSQLLPPSLSPSFPVSLFSSLRPFFIQLNMKYLAWKEGTVMLDPGSWRNSATVSASHCHPNMTQNHRSHKCQCCKIKPHQDRVVLTQPVADPNPSSKSPTS